MYSSSTTVLLNISIKISTQLMLKRRTVYRTVLFIMYAYISPFPVSVLCRSTFLDGDCLL